MRILWPSLLLSVLSFSCYNAERHCGDFKTGRFRSEVTLDGTLLKSEFVRTESLQIETFNGRTDSSSVRWINDCEMVFKTIHPKSMAEKKDVHLKILSTTDTTYIFEYAYVGETRKVKGIAFKID